MPRRRRRKAAANPRRRKNRAAAENPRRRRKARSNPRKRRKARNNPRKRRKARSNPRRRRKARSNPRRRRKARSNPRRRRRTRAAVAENPRRRRRKAKSNPRRRRRARSAVAENPRRRRRARSNPRRRRRARAAVAENPRRRRRKAKSNPRRRRRARAVAENPRRRRKARSNPRRRRKARAALANPRHRRRHARSYPHQGVGEVLSAVVASGAGYLAADLWHRFANTYDPAAQSQPTNKFVGGDGTAANAKNIALPPDWFSMGGQAALAIAPFAAAHFGKIRQRHVKSALQGFGIGAGAHLFGQIITDFVLVKLLKNNAIVSRLFPQEIKAQADAQAANYQVAGTLGGHPPLIEELHTMFPHVPKHLLHSFGVGFGPSYDAGSYSP